MNFNLQDKVLYHQHKSSYYFMIMQISSWLVAYTNSPNNNNNNANINIRKLKVINSLIGFHKVLLNNLISIIEERVFFFFFFCQIKLETLVLAQ